MPDPHMTSIHLQGQPRRDEFRTARQILLDACGENTQLGDERLLGPDERFDAPTVALPPSPGALPVGRLTCYLKDGVNVFPLRTGMNSVGRLLENDVVIHDECVSRRHCAVVVHTDFRCELHDVASKNGTLLNGQKINGPTRMQSGDQITLCKKKLVFVITEAVAMGSGEL